MIDGRQPRGDARRLVQVVFAACFGDMPYFVGRGHFRHDRASYFLLHRLQVRDDRVNFVFFEQTLIGRHHCGVRLDNLLLRFEETFTNVVLINLDRRAIRKLFRAAKDAFERRTLHARAIERMAGIAAALGVELLTELCRRNRLLALQSARRNPLVEFRSIDDLHVREHFGVTHPAILGAEDLRFAIRVRFEPNGRVRARNDVLLHPELGDEEAVKHVLRAHDELDGPVLRQHEPVHLGTPVGIGERPHVHLSRRANLHCIRRRDRGHEVALQADEEERNDHDARNDGPADFELRTMRDATHFVVVGSPTKTTHEVKHRDHQTEEHEYVHVIHDIPCVIDFPGNRRGLSRKPERAEFNRVQRHATAPSTGFACRRRSARQYLASNAARPMTVKTPPAFIRRLVARTYLFSATE